MLFSLFKRGFAAARAATVERVRRIALESFMVGVWVGGELINGGISDCDRFIVERAKKGSENVKVKVVIGIQVGVVSLEILQSTKLN